MAQGIYKENHYVTQWYQRRFLPTTGEQKFRYLDLRPETFLDAKGIKRRKKSLQRWGTDRCFKQTDLYTTRFGAAESTEIEQFFFGRVDREGREAVEYFANFSHPSADGDAFQALLNYMSVQKLRTPKGLAHFAEMTKLNNKNAVLLAMQSAQNLHRAIWTEAVWSIAEAAETVTKFIVSDKLVAVHLQEQRALAGLGDRRLKAILAALALFDADHLGAVLRHQHRAIRSGDISSEVEHTDAFEHTYHLRSLPVRQPSPRG